MFSAILLAAALVRPPDGTYAFRLRAAGANLGTSTVVVSTAGNRITAVENVSLPAQQVTAKTTTVYDAATLDELSYAADFHLPSGTQHTAVTLAGGKATIDAGSQHVVLQADPSAPVLLTTDNLPGDSLWFPAVVHAHHASAISLAVLAGGRVIVQHVQSDKAGTLTTSIDQLTLTYSYDPKTDVVRAMDVPLQQAQVLLTSQTGSTAPAAAPSPVPTAVPLPPARYRSEDVTFTSSDGTRLAGTLTIPDGAASHRAAVVLVHGSGPENRNEQIGPNPVFAQLANALSNAGFVVLRYDKRGIGQSGGDARSMTREQLVQDVEAAFRFVRAQAGVDPARVFLLGHSEGGELVPSVAAATPGVAGIVLMAPPALPLAQISMEQTLESVPASQRSQTRIAEAAALAKIRSGATTGPDMALYRDSMDYDPVKDIARVRVPILILQGGADVQVLPKDLPRLLKAAKQHNAHVTARIFPGDNHLFMRALPGTDRTPQAALEQYLEVPGSIDPAVLAALIGWLERPRV
jgi:alpha-beta hydrolase superfamily lysophospholipase